jgi:hypothetical protein
MAEEQCVIISRSVPKQFQWWYDTWRSQQFNCWDDAKEWLSDDYNADVIKFNDGFKIRFRNNSDLVLFKLTWM